MKRTSRGLALATSIVLSSALGEAQTQVTAWCIEGQTFVVWMDSAPTPDSYQVYASATDFLAAGTISGGSEVGRLMEPDWRGARLNVALPGSTYRVPLPGGAWYQLAPHEGVFAYTPKERGVLHFAVVKEGQQVVTANNTSGPVVQVPGQPTAHHQGTRLTPASGQTLQVYAHWLDGDDDHGAGREDYPVMGNSRSNGVGSIFLLTEPTGGLTGSPLPLVVALHGGGGNIMRFVGGGTPEIGLEFGQALLLTPDGTINTRGGTVGCAWLGYWEDHDRFAWPPTTSVPDGALVVDYAMRRLLWQIDWASENFAVDTERISLLGHSGGARGASQVARAYPERFASVHMYCAAMQTGVDNPLFGRRDQNLPTTLPGGPGVADVADERVPLSLRENDLPFTRIVIGRADTSSSAGWGLDKVEKFHDIDALRLGRHLFFDERGHDMSLWAGARFSSVSMLEGEALLRHRADQSYPAFFGDDHDPSTPGTQPDMGDGTPLDGDLYGTFGGYYDWDRSTIVDLPHTWLCTFWLEATSVNPAENFENKLARVGVAVRRPQLFEPLPGREVVWRLTRVSDQSVLQAGVTTSDPNGLLSVDGLLIPPSPEQVRLQLNVVP